MQRFCMLSRISVFVFLTLLLVCKLAHTKESYPTKPIIITNPYAAGGTGDREIRSLAPHLQKFMGVPVVVQNLTGAGGRIAYAKIFSESPDGYDLCYINMPAANLGELLYEGKYKTLQYSYIYNIVKEYRLVAVKMDSPFKNFKDLMEASKIKPPTVSVSGLGSSSHMASVLLEKAGLKNRSIPFDGAAPSRAAFLGGHVDFWVPDASDVGKLLQDKMIRLLAALSPTRLTQFPEVPTVKELGYGSVEVYTSRGFIAPPGLPRDIKEKLVYGIDKALHEPEFQDWAKKMGVSLYPLKGEEFDKLAKEIQEQSVMVVPIMKEAIEKK